MRPFPMLTIVGSLFFSTSANAASDCHSLVSGPVSKATIAPLLECVESEPRLLLQKRAGGRTLLMDMAVADIGPAGVDDALWFVEDPNALTEALIATDPQGRTTIHLVAAEGQRPEILTVLSSWGAAVNDEYDKGDGWLDGGTTPLHLAATRSDGEVFVATLLALGAVPTMDKNEKTPADLAWDKETASLEGAILLLDEGEWPSIFEFDPSRYNKPATSECGRLLKPEFWQQDTLLLDAATDDSSELLMDHLVQCLTSPTQFDAVDSEGNTILHLAARYAEDPELIDIILAKAPSFEALVKRRNSSDQTALHIAAEHTKSPWLMARILAWGADPDSLSLEVNRFGRKNKGISPLHIVANRSDESRLELLTILLAYQADTMVQNIEGKSAITGKPVAGDRTALHLLVLAPDPNGLLLLMEAQASQENLIASIFRGMFGKSIKQIEDSTGRTALHIAAARNADLYSISNLLAYGFSVDEPDGDGATPLMYAAKNISDKEMFLSMLELSEKPCAVSRSGASVEAELKSNGKINVEDPSGQTLTPLGELKKRCAQ